MASNTIQCPKCGGFTYALDQHLCRVMAHQPVICKSCGMTTVDLQNHNCAGLKATPSKVDPCLEGIENRRQSPNIFDNVKISNNPHDLYSRAPTIEELVNSRTYLAVCQQQFNDHMAEVGRLSSRMAVRPLDFAVVSSLVVHMNQAQSALTKMQGILGEQEYKKS